MCNKIIFYSLTKKTMKKQLLFILTLALALVCTNANAYELLKKQPSWTEITSVDELSGSTFSLKNASGKFLYTPSGWDIKVGDETAFLSSNTQGGFFKLEALDTHWLIPVYEKTGDRRTYWAGNQYVNAQPTGNVIFGLAGTNDQHGQDGANLAVWDITYTEGNGFAFHCVGRDIYIGSDDEYARPSAEEYYWKAYSFTTVYDAAQAEAAYNEIKDLQMSGTVKTALNDAKAAYDAEQSAENLNKYGDAVNVAIKNIELLADVTPGADKTAAIANADAEDGVKTPWEGLARVINNQGNAHSGSWLFETAGWGPKHSEMKQTVQGLPAGKYELSAYFMGAAETFAKLHGNDAVSAEVQGSGDSGDDRWKKISVTCTVEEDGVLVILAEGNTEAEKNWCNFDDFSLKYLCPFNTISAGLYTITADVALADGVSETMVPADFKKYLGTYTTNAALEGDKASLVITENKEDGLFKGFEIEGDAVTLSADKTIVLGGKTFTVRAAGSDEETGVLAITANNEGYKMESADIYYNGKKAATVSNITIAKAVEEVICKVTYVDYDNPDQVMTLEDGKSLSGFNKISNGEVGLGNAGWGKNYLTYILVDAYTMAGTVKKATLKAKVSGSTDSRRTTAWGVGYNDSKWSENMTWNTADKSITTVGEIFNGTTKSSTSFEDATFDITDAFADGKKVKTILLYETAAAGGYVKDVTVEIEMAGTPLEAAKEKAIAAVDKLTPGNDLFCYPAEEIAAYKEAVNAAETVEAVEAIALPKQNLPEEEAYYNIENKTAEGLYLNGTKISSAKGETKLEATEGGYYIKFDGGYLNVKANSTWDMELAENPVTVWTFNYVDGFYTLKNSYGLLGTDDTAEGSSVYADKSADNNGYWKITKSDATAVDVVKATETAAPTTRKYIDKNGIVIEKNGVKYNVAGQMK